MSNHRHRLAQGQRWVVKIGSALLTADGQGLDQVAMKAWVQQMVELQRAGVDLVLVSSGAVAEGMVRMGLKSRPDSVHELQAVRPLARWVWCRHMSGSFVSMA